MLLQVIAIALICVFTSKTYAYTLNENGNLVSQNLLDKQYISTQGNISLNLDSTKLTINGSLTGNDLYFNISLFTELEVGQTYTMSFDTDIINVMYDAWINGTHYYVNRDNDLTFTLTNDLKTSGAWRFVVGAGAFNNSLVNIMINEGNTALAYEPYGTWYNQQYYDQLQEVANGVQYGTLQYLYYMEFKDSVTQEPIEKDGLTEFTLDYLKEHNAVSNSGSLAVNYFINSTTNPNEHPYTIVMYFNTQVSINMLSMMFTSYATGTIEVYGNTSTIINFSDSNQLIDYQDFNGTAINYINELYVNFSSADAISNISFNSFASQSYQYGFDYGQTIGDQKGYDRGYEQGNADGYQRGLNEGAEQDLENGGMKVLFNSILSYPVNLIRSVFDFEFMGINVASLVMFIVSIGIVAYVITKFL